MFFSQNIDGFQTKQFTRLLEFIQLYKQNPLEDYLFLHWLPNYTLALKCTCHHFFFFFYVKGTQFRSPLHQYSVKNIHQVMK